MTILGTRMQAGLIIHARSGIFLDVWRDVYSLAIAGLSSVSSDAREKSLS
jgi:hypothetical protein